MIVDNIKNADLYKNISKDIRTGLEYIKKTNFNKLEEGKHVIDGEDIFAVYSSYNTKSIDDSKYEGHKQYIDIQYIVSGEEKMYGMDISECNETTQYDENNDVQFFKGNSSWEFKASQNTFAVFYPNDIHMPGVVYKNSEKVHKVVIKIRVK